VLSFTLSKYVPNTISQKQDDKSRRRTLAFETNYRLITLSHPTSPFVTVASAQHLNLLVILLGCCSSKERYSVSSAATTGQTV